MYSVRLGYGKAINCINKLMEHKHYSEAFVVTVFTVEKILRRTLHQLIISSGFSTKITKKILKTIRGIDNIKNHWIFYDLDNRRLVDIIGQNNWNKIKDFSRMRNELIHGKRVYNREKCRTSTEELLTILNEVKKKLGTVYGFSGWERLTARHKSKLHIDPKVKIK